MSAEFAVGEKVTAIFDGTITRVEADLDLYRLDGGANGEFAWVGGDALTAYPTQVFEPGDFLRARDGDGPLTLLVTDGFVEFDDEGVARYFPHDGDLPRGYFNERADEFERVTLVEPPL